MDSEDFADQCRARLSLTCAVVSTGLPSDKKKKKNFIDEILGVLKKRFFKKKIVFLCLNK